MPGQPNQPVVFDSRLLWYLAAGTTLVEIDSGRTFSVGRQPGELWRGNTPCTVEALDLPVQILGRALTGRHVRAELTTTTDNPERS